MIVRKFESFQENLYEVSDYDWYIAHKRVGMSDDEYFKLENYFTKLGALRVLPFSQPTKHTYNPSSFFSISLEFSAKTTSGWPTINRSSVSKMDDEWWFVINVNDASGYVAHYKCDTMKGVFQLFDSFKCKGEKLVSSQRP